MGASPHKRFYMAIDIELLKIQYEILNVSIDSIARSTGIPADLIELEVKRGGWTRLWPDEDEPKLQIEEDEDVFTVSSSSYIKKTQRRLQAYSLAKEVLLATRYLQLESNLIQKANDALDALTDTNLSQASGLKTLSSLYRDLVKNGIGGSTGLQLQTDEDGLPMVIIKDLSGQGDRS